MLASKGNHYAAYHCQQAAEKLIKAILLHRNREAGVEHRLDFLLDMLPDSDPWKMELRALVKYTPYATAFRYPTPGGRISAAPAPDQINADAAHIRGLIAKFRTELGITT